MGLIQWTFQQSLIRVVMILVLVNLWSNKVSANEMTILALGDSLTAGYLLPQGDSFAAQLEKKLIEGGHDVKVINAGVSGDTTKGGLGRLNWAMADNPDMVIVELGANDALRGIKPEYVYENLDGILSMIKERGLPVLLAGMLAPPNMGDDYSGEFNAIYPRLAKEYDVTLYPFFLDGVAGKPELNFEDGIHPTTQGVAIIVERILPYVLKVMNKGS